MAPVSKTELIHEIWVSNLAKGGWEIPGICNGASRRRHCFRRMGDAMS